MLTCQEYIFKLTSGQLKDATRLEKLGALQHRLICRNCRNFTANDHVLSDVLHHYKQHVTSADHPSQE